MSRDDHTDSHPPTDAGTRTGNRQHDHFKAPENATDELSHVAALELQLLDPAVRSDAARLSELLHPEFIEHGASGRVWTRQEIIDELPREDATTPSTTASDLVAQHLTNDVILVTFTTASTIKRAVRSSIWLQSTDGDWRIRFHQGTPTD